MDTTQPPMAVADLASWVLTTDSLSSLMARKRCTLAVTGLPGVGKSTLVREICRKADGQAFAIENKHWGRFNRAEKLQRGLTGLEPESYEDGFISDVRQILAGRQVSKCLYDHSTGRFSSTRATFLAGTKRLCILEGCVWLFPEYKEVVDVSVHIHPASYETWKRNVATRDKLQRGCRQADVDQRLSLFYRFYQDCAISQVGPTTHCFAQLQFESDFLFIPIVIDSIRESAIL